jgi:hypothetical protein
VFPSRNTDPSVKPANVPLTGSADTGLDDRQPPIRGRRADRGDASTDGVVQLRDVTDGLRLGTFGGADRLITWDLAEDGRALVTA